MENYLVGWEEGARVGGCWALASFSLWLFYFLVPAGKRVYQSHCEEGKG